MFHHQGQPEYEFIEIPVELDDKPTQDPVDPEDECGLLVDVYLRRRSTRMNPTRMNPTQEECNIYIGTQVGKTKRSVKLAYKEGCQSAESFDSMTL